MKRLLVIFAALLLCLELFAQSPQKLSYQSIIRNSSGKLVMNAPVGIQITILQGSPSGSAVYTETHSATTNANGLVSLEIGGGTTSGNFSSINWANGPYYVKTETDPAGGTNYTVTGTSQLLSVPYSLYSVTAGNGFSGDYNDLTNKPVTDGSETKVQGGTNITVTGNGTQATPYILTGSSNPNPPPVNNTIILTDNQNWTVPGNVSKIKVELWGASGGGGGAGAYSYSYNLISGGDGGSGGYAKDEMTVTPGQQFFVSVGNPGYAGNNAYYSYPSWYGDTDGGTGGDTWFGSLKAAGGTGGKRGSYTVYTVNGNAGANNIGSVTAYADPPNSNILTIFMGMPRSYIYDRVLTSKPGRGGSLVSGYSTSVPKSGEGGCVVITFWE
jgi:hypothetical protein